MPVGPMILQEDGILCIMKITFQMNKYFVHFPILKLNSQNPFLNKAKVGARKEMYKYLFRAKISTVSPIDNIK